MSATQPLLLTPKGLNKLRLEYNLLKNRYKRLAEELHEATMEQSEDSRLLNGLKGVEHEFLSDRLGRLELTMKRATLMVSGRSGDTISLGSLVTYNLAGVKWTVRLVESIEANPLEGSVSITSPLGQALEGAIVGQTVVVQAPKRSYTIQVQDVQ